MLKQVGSCRLDRLPEWLILLVVVDVSRFFSVAQVVDFYEPKEAVGLYRVDWVNIRSYTGPDFFKYGLVFY